MRTDSTVDGGVLWLEEVVYHLWLSGSAIAVAACLLDLSKLASPSGEIGNMQQLDTEAKQP